MGFWDSTPPLSLPHYYIHLNDRIVRKQPKNLRHSVENIFVKFHKKRSMFDVQYERLICA